AGRTGVPPQLILASAGGGVESGRRAPLRSHPARRISAVPRHLTAGSPAGPPRMAEEATGIRTGRHPMADTLNSLGSRDTLDVGGKALTYYRLQAATDALGADLAK